MYIELPQPFNIYWRTKIYTYMISYFAMPGTPHRKWSKRQKHIVFSVLQDRIIDSVCYYYCIDRIKLRERNKLEQAVHKRAIASYLLMLYGKITLAEVATFLQCHYSSIIYYRNLVKDQLSVKPSNQFKNDISILTALIHNSKID